MGTDASQSFTLVVSGGVFFTLTPCRVADTRQTVPFTGPFGAPALGAGALRTMSLPAGGCGVPVSAAGYSLNVTVVPFGTLGYLTTWPAGQPQPLTSTLNSFRGYVVANAALVPAALGGGIDFFATDRGFSLAFDPRASATSGVVAARLREDAHDWLLYERLGKPATYKYSFDPSKPGEEAKIVPYSPLFGGTGAEGRYRFEAEGARVERDGGEDGVQSCAESLSAHGRVVAAGAIDRVGRRFLHLIVSHYMRFRILSSLLAIQTAAQKSDPTQRQGQGGQPGGAGLFRIEIARWVSQTAAVRA